MKKIGKIQSAYPNICNQFYNGFDNKYCENYVSCGNCGKIGSTFYFLENL